MKEIILGDKQYLLVKNSTRNKLIGYRIHENVYKNSNVNLSGTPSRVIKIDNIVFLGNDLYRLFNSNVSITVKLLKR